MKDLSSCNPFIYFSVLSGAETDLRFLSSLFQKGEAFYVLSVSDEDGTQYQLHADRFMRSADLVNEEENWQFVEAESAHAIRLMNGAAKLIQSHYTPIGIDSFHKCPKKGRNIVATERPTRPAKNYAIPTRHSNLVALSQEWVKHGYQNANVSFALQTYGNIQPSWASLRAIFETIQDDIGGEMALRKKNWLPVEQIQSLKRSRGNHHTIYGHTAHSRSTSVQLNTKKTSLFEAEESIRHILNLWLSEKIGVIKRRRISNL
ncbi:MAG: hypothetical protein ACTSXQ_06365 [Alphaproteobacteria bacterium]